MMKRVGVDPKRKERLSNKFVPKENQGVVSFLEVSRNQQALTRTNFFSRRHASRCRRIAKSPSPIKPLADLINNTDMSHSVCSLSFYSFRKQLT